LLADQFTGFDTGLPVIPIGKSVISTSLPILDFSNAKFEFGAVFAQFHGNQSYQWQAVFEAIPVFQSFTTA
jgi:hypothetical protein